MIIPSSNRLMWFSVCWIFLASLILHPPRDRSLLARASQSDQECETDQQACYWALNCLKESNQEKDDIAFFFGYLSGRLNVSLPSRWKKEFEAKDSRMVEFPSNRVFEGETELSDADIEARGISSFIPRQVSRCVHIASNKHNANLIFIASFGSWTSPCDVKCIDTKTKNIIWSRHVRSNGGSSSGADWNYIQLVSSADSVFVFGMTSSFCYIERIDEKNGRTNLGFYATPMDFPNWETHRVKVPWDIGIEEPRGPTIENHQPK